MAEETLTKVLAIKNRLGLHARAAALLVQTVADFQADIKVSKDGQVVDGRSILGLLMLAAAQGSTIEITVQGPDAAKALEAIEDLVTRGFDESE
ncbi:MAG: phosphocarrier protein HPr [Candidatus Binatia bacterium]|nr:MAG: phosphocarrier protein HPr [Candidatus Binatia bacterium]